MTILAKKRKLKVLSHETKLDHLHVHTCTVQDILRHQPHCQGHDCQVMHLKGVFV